MHPAPTLAPALALALAASLAAALAAALIQSKRFPRQECVPREWVFILKGGVLERRSSRNLSPKTLSLGFRI